jgi:hypothetical protein
MSADPIVITMVETGWVGMLLGVVTGALIGLFFHREDWMGGYGSYRRRLTRLGHISFFGLALVNFSFAFTQTVTPLNALWSVIAMRSFMIGAATMPTVCFLTAWRKSFRHLFFIPVGAVLIGVIGALFGR